LLGTIDLLDEDLKPVESEKDLAIEAQKLVRECCLKSERFRHSIVHFDALTDPTLPNGDVASFSFQLADLLPTSQKEKQKMLSSETLSDRLKLQTHLLRGYLQPEQSAATTSTTKTTTTKDEPKSS
jgi:Lon protease-like protein